MNDHELPDATCIVWRKSSHSNAGNQCVEVARTSAGFIVRDSKSPESPRLSISPTAWDALINGVKHGGTVLNEA